VDEEEVFNWEEEQRYKAMKNDDIEKLPDDWYVNAVLIVRGRKKDIRDLIDNIIPDMTACEEADFDVRVVFRSMSTGRFNVRRLNGNRHNE